MRLAARHATVSWGAFVIAASVGCSNATSRVSAGDGGSDARVYGDGGPPGSEDGGSLDADTAEDAGSEAGDPDVTEPPVALGPVGTGTDVLGATAADGTALLVVTDGKDSGPFSSSHYEPSSGWTPMTPGQVSMGAWGPILASALAMDAKGDGVFAWFAYEGSSNPKSVAGAARYDHLTGTWGFLGGLCESTYGGFQPVPVAVNASGDALLACEGTTVNHYSATTRTWSSETIDPAANGAAIFDLSLSDTGLAVAIYGQSYPASLATRSADGTWTPNPASPACSQTLYYYAAAIDAGGDVLLGLASAGGLTLAGCYYAAATRTWTGPSPLGSFSGSSGATLTAALTQTGDGVLVAGHPGLVVYPYLQSSGTWSSPAGLASATAGVLALNRQGVGLAISGDGVDGSPTQELRVHGYSLTTGWGPASAPIGSCDTSFTAFVSPTGTAWAAWIDGARAFVDRVR